LSIKVDARILMFMSGDFLNIKEAALILNVSKLTLRNWDKSGKLPALRHPISNYRVYKRAEVMKIIEQIESGEVPIRRSVRIPRKLVVKHEDG